ncbi:MAG: hypothetical protein KGJ07_00080 [Patescibacteria group bacterium]|nr:hypothetical protein [Patescibacteria group bacterium]
MTTLGAQTYQQIFNRLVAQLPPWFNNPQFVDQPIVPDLKNATTNFNNVTWAFLITALNSYLQMQYVWLQMRIGAYEIFNDDNYPADYPNTLAPIATGNSLDLIAQDFFGNGLTRRPNESDDNFRNRILTNLMSVKCTRPAMLTALSNLVLPAFEQAGIKFVPPEIYEGWYPLDNGGLNVDMPPTIALGTNGGPNGIGSLGSGSNAYQCTIYVFLPEPNGLATFPGLLTYGESITWGAGLGGGTDIPPQWLGSDDALNYYITESDILNVINMTKVLGTVCHLIIEYVN